VLSVIDLYGDSSFGMTVIPQWIKNTSAFGLVVFCHPTIICIVPLETDRLPDTLVFAISSPRIWANSAPKGKKNFIASQRFRKK